MVRAQGPRPRRGPDDDAQPRRNIPGRGLKRRSAPPRRLLALERHVLVGRRVAVAWDQAESRLANPGTDTVDEGLPPKRCVDGSLVNELLDFVQGRGAPRAVEFARLLREQRVDVGIAAVYISTAFCHEGLEASRRVAEQTALALDEIPEALLGVALEEGRPLERPQLAADTHLLEVVEHGFGEAGVG